MAESYIGNTLWHLVWQSDGITKVVLGILLLMSIICWSVFLYKLLLLRQKKEEALKILAILQKMSSYDELKVIGQQLGSTAIGYFIARTIRSVDGLHSLSAAHVDRSFLYWQQVESDMYQTVDEMADAEQSYLWILSTSAAAATLLGLFGTVWGLVHAFLRISQAQSADITTVAPGIAEALLTTLAGLMVAIPALILFNYLSVVVRRTEGYYMEIAAESARIIQTVFLG